MTQHTNAEPPRRAYDRLNLGSDTAEVKSDADCISIFVEPKPILGSYRKSTGIMYRAHIKWDPAATWEENISEDARDWETRQRSTPLWETARTDGFNYDPEPRKCRPRIKALTNLLREKGAPDIADRIDEAYDNAA